MDSKIVIGATGLIGSGKSYVCQEFAELGADYQDSDKVAHQILDNEAKNEIAEEFGTNDRSELAKIVYNNPDKLKKLESIIHPKVRSKNLEFIKNSNSKIIVLEIPLLFETKAEEICDYVIFVNVSRETLQNRVMLRPNMNIEKLESILEKQTRITNKAEMADFIIENEPNSDIVAQVERIYKIICAK